MLHQGSGGQLCFVEPTAEKPTAVAAELAGAGLVQLLGERAALLPGFVGFFQIAFNPMQSAFGSPTVRAELHRLFGLQPVPPPAPQRR